MRSIVTLRYPFPTGNRMSPLLAWRETRRTREKKRETTIYSLVTFSTVTKGTPSYTFISTNDISTKSINNFPPNPIPFCSIISLSLPIHRQIILSQFANYRKNRKRNIISSNILEDRRSERREKKKREKWEEAVEIEGPGKSRSVQSSPIEDALGNCTVIMAEWNRGRDEKDGKECRR